MRKVKQLLGNKKRLSNLIVFISVIALLLGGCGNKTTDTKTASIDANAVSGKDKTGSENVADEEDIELLEPVGAMQSFDIASNRNMYDSLVLSSVVVPKVTEYSASKDQYFDRYGISSGGKVEISDPLVYFRTEAVNKELQKLDEEIADFESDHASEIDILNKRIYDSEKSVFKANSSYMEMYAFAPDESNEGAYSNFSRMVLPAEGAYKRELLACDRLKQQLLEKEDLYQIELDYYNKKRELLIEKNSEASITSNVSGEVVAIGYYYDGDFVNKDAGIIAVGDMSIKLLKTDYVTKETVAKACDVYAIVNGKRYEITYEPMDSVVYNQLINKDGVAYSSFYIEDPTDEIKVGDYAVVVIIKDRRNDVLTIPQSALIKDNNDYYVYKLDENKTSIYTPVDIGFKDGVYAEVLSGISEGDKVLTDSAPKKGKNTLTLAYDRCYTALDTSGFLYYPTSSWIRNPIEYGSTYVKEVLVENNEVVSKDQVLMTLESYGDDIEIDRLTREISRTQERLNKKLEKKAENDDRNKVDRGLEETIANMQKTIERDSRALAKLTKYSGLIEIKAPYDGIVTDKVAFEAGDLVKENDNLIRISDSSSSFVVVQDTNDQLCYGNAVTLSYKDADWKEISIEGRAVTINNTSLSSELRSEYSLIAIPEENIGDIALSTKAAGGNWQRAMIKVSLDTRSMDNVIVIPKSAVSMENGKTYVTAVMDDGSVKKIGFVSGGGNINSYWVAEGLTEGMTICWE